MHEASPVFTVIVPTHDRPGQLACCIQALAELDCPRDCFEVIVVDDGGAVSLTEVEDRFRDQLSLTFLRQDQAGPAAARNNGARHAKGRYLALTDDDCAPATGWLSRLRECFEQDSGKLYGGKTINGLPGNRCAAASQVIIDVVYALQAQLPNFPQFFATNNFALCAEGFLEAGGFSESFQPLEDREFCDRWVHQGCGMAIVPEAIVHHSHDLDFPALMRQHFAYGRGAFRFHQLRAKRHWGHFHFYGRFYLALLQRCRTRKFSESELRWLAGTAGTQ